MEFGTRNTEHGTQNAKHGTRNSERRKSRGLSLVELIVFIVVVSVAVAGVLAALNVATRASADPMIQKQAPLIAGSYSRRKREKRRGRGPEER